MRNQLMTASKLIKILLFTNSDMSPVPCFLRIKDKNKNSPSSVFSGAVATAQTLNDILCAAYISTIKPGRGSNSKPQQVETIVHYGMLEFLKFCIWRTDDVTKRGKILRKCQVLRSILHPQADRLHVIWCKILRGESFDLSNDAVQKSIIVFRCLDNCT